MLYEVHSRNADLQLTERELGNGLFSNRDYDPDNGRMTSMNASIFPSGPLISTITCSGLTSTIFPRSPLYDHQPVREQIADGRMAGFLASFAKGSPIDPDPVMGFYNGAQLATYDMLARPRPSKTTKRSPARRSVTSVWRPSSMRCRPRMWSGPITSTTSAFCGW